MELAIAKTVAVEKKWMRKDNAMKHFDFAGNQVRSFGVLLSEFKSHPDFSQGYLNPTYKLVLIDIDLFEQFLIWKHDNKFKGE